MLSTLRNWMRGAATAGAIGLLAACGGGSDHNTTPPAPGTIVQVAQGDASFSTLVAALQFASNNGDLVNTLSGAGPFTVFAPTNAAFDALAQELTGSATARGADLLTAANKDLLRAVLTYHVLGAKVERAQVPAGRAIQPVGGGFFKVDAVGSSLVITDGRNRTTTIAATDVQASNGVIHAISRVILPANKTIVQTAQGVADLSTLVAVLGFASNNNDLVNTLNGTGTFTVFAPTNAAFDALARELTGNANARAADLLTEANKPLLRTVLTYHVLSSRVLKGEVPVGTPIATLAGATNTFTVNSALVITDGRNRTANIIATDVFTSNGVVHLIDRVILPRP
jgi:uncharacterized surface protein with fasciclin (FAS1) repeats